jgi:hypothetical protein
LKEISQKVEYAIEQHASFQKLFNEEMRTEGDGIKEMELLKYNSQKQVLKCSF